MSDWEIIAAAFVTTQPAQDAAEDALARLRAREQELETALREQVAWFQAHPNHACGAVANIARAALEPRAEE